MVVFVDISAVLALVCEKKHTKRKGDERAPRVFIVFWRVQKGGVNEEGGV